MKRKYILIAAIFFFFLVLIAIGYISAVQHVVKNTNLFPGIAAPTPIPNNDQKTTVTPVQSNSTIYDVPGSDAKLLLHMQQPQALSTADTTAENTTTASLNNQPGSPVTTDDYRVDYLPAAHLFQVEILITDYQKARQEATTWFLSQGFTKEGLCKLPVEFYLNWNIKQALEGTPIQFNPLPDGC